MLQNLGADLERVRRQVVDLLGGTTPGSAKRETRARKTPTLDQFGRDLTELAREGKLDPVVGRENEIQRVIQVLSRRTKNNPVLIGDPGVGKTAIVEGLAQMIVQGNVPETLNDKRVVSLDLGALWPVRNSAVSSRSASRKLWTKYEAQATSFCSSMKCIRYRRRSGWRVPSMHPISSPALSRRVAGLGRPPLMSIASMWKRCRGATFPADSG